MTTKHHHHLAAACIMPSDSMQLLTFFIYQTPKGNDLEKPNFERLSLCWSSHVNKTEDINALMYNNQKIFPT